MPRGYRSAIYAAGLIALLVLSTVVAKWIYDEAEHLQHRYEHQAKQKAKAYADRAYRHIERRCLRLVPETVDDCAREEFQIALNGQHDEYDLQAQLVTSAWTRAMGIAATIAMAAGLFGIGLVFVTFRATRRAASSAEKTYRAFVRVEDASLIVDFPTGILDQARGEDYYSLRCTVTNVGRSAARLHTNYLGDVAFEIEKTLPVNATITLDGLITVKGKDTRTIEGFLLYSTALNERARLYVSGVIHPLKTAGEFRGRVKSLETEYGTGD